MDIVPFMGTGIKAAILGFLNKKIQIVPFTGTGIKIPANFSRCAMQ